MPTTYTHWRFGNDIICTLPDKYQNIINKHRHEFDFGVHGPDMFFYHDVFKKNEVTKYGYGNHLKPAKEHFKLFKENYQSHPNKDAAFAYILGYLAHFTLDSYCHTYVNTKAKLGIVSHLRIEAQFDRYLLIKDGKDPIKSSLTFSLYPKYEVADNIYYIYKVFDKKLFRKIIKEMKLMLDILKDTSTFKRNIMSFVLDKFKASNFKDLFTDDYNDPLCYDSNLRLYKYYQKALEHYPELANEIIDYFENNKELGSYFNNDFDHKEYMKNLPILSYEEEKNYIVEKQE